MVAERDVPAALHRDTLGAQAADLATAVLAGGHLLVAVRRHLRLPVHQMLDFVEQLTEASEAERPPH